MIDRPPSRGDDDGDQHSNQGRMFVIFILALLVSLSMIMLRRFDADRGPDEM
jgi:hypothetical protein